MNTSPFAQQLVGSPCCLPKMERDRLYDAYRRLGFTKFEAFSTWTACRHDWRGDAAAERAAAARFGLQITSYHLPPVGPDENLADALAAACYAARLGAKVLLFKVAKKELLAATCRRFLDAVEQAALPVTVAVQNHAGSAISSLQDCRDALAAVNGDRRLRAVLEVGHFRRVGEDWRAGRDVWGDRVALIHVNEIRAGKSVPYGTGETDFRGLVAHLKKTGYTGGVVTELELENHEQAPDETLAGLAGAIKLLTEIYDHTP